MWEHCLALGYSVAFVGGEIILHSIVRLLKWLASNEEFQKEKKIKNNYTIYVFDSPWTVNSRAEQLDELKYNEWTERNIMEMKEKRKKKWNYYDCLLNDKNANGMKMMKSRGREM